MAKSVKIAMEHPGDWHSQEGPFAKACSQLGYRLLTLADKERDNSYLAPGVFAAFAQFHGYLDVLGE